MARADRVKPAAGGLAQFASFLSSAAGGFPRENGLAADSLRARHDQPGLVGDDDGLGTVAEPELAQHVAHVRLDSLVAQDQSARRSRDSRAPPATSPRISVSRGVSADSVVRSQLPRTQACELGDQAARDRGRERASPPAMTRTASNKVSAGTSLSRNPLAPACSASYT